MTLIDAKEILHKHQEWRRFDGDSEDSPVMQDSIEVGLALDRVIGSRQEVPNLIAKQLMNNTLLLELLTELFLELDEKGKIPCFSTENNKFSHELVITNYLESHLRGLELKG